MDGVFERIQESNGEISSVSKALNGVLAILEDGRDGSTTAALIIIEALQEKLIRAADTIDEAVTSVARALSGR